MLLLLFPALGEGKAPSLLEAAPAVAFPAPSCIMLQKSACTSLIIRTKQGEILCKCQTRLPWGLGEHGQKVWGGKSHGEWAAFHPWSVL